MMPLKQQTQARKDRSVRLIFEPEEDRVGAFCVTVGTNSTYYAVKEIHCEIGGRGFAVHKLGMGDLYHVRIGSVEDCSCDCKGFLRYTYCRHVLGLKALADAEKL